MGQSRWKEEGVDWLQTGHSCPEAMWPRLGRRRPAHEAAAAAHLLVERPGQRLVSTRSSPCPGCGTGATCFFSSRDLDRPLTQAGPSLEDNTCPVALGPHTGCGQTGERGVAGLCVRWYKVGAASPSPASPCSCRSPPGGPRQGWGGAGLSTENAVLVVGGEKGV